MRGMACHGMHEGGMPCHVVAASCLMCTNEAVVSWFFHPMPSSWLAHASSPRPPLPAGTHSGPRAGTTDALLNVARQVRPPGRMCFCGGHVAGWQHGTAMAHDGAPHIDRSTGHVQHRAWAFFCPCLRQLQLPLSLPQPIPILCPRWFPITSLWRRSTQTCWASSPSPSCLGWRWAHWVRAGRRPACIGEISLLRLPQCACWVCNSAP